MIARFRYWLAGRRVARQHEAERRGFDWAAGIILRHNDLDSAELEIDSWTLGGQEYWRTPLSMFDHGAQLALKMARDRFRPVYVVCDGLPGPQGGRFIQVEDDESRSYQVGEWHARLDGMFELRIKR